jgi:hypothetical protein
MATEDQIIKKLAELKLADTPANRKIAIEALTDTGDKKISEMTQEEVAAFFGSAGQQSGTNYLLGYEFPSRIVKGSKEGIAVDPKDFETAGGGGAGRRTVYRGPLLVDENGIVTRAQYDLSPLTDANTILLELIKDPTQYKYYTNLLQTRGFYGNSKPSTNRVDSVDRSAMAEFLNNFANANGVTYKTAFQILEGTPQVQSSGKKAPSVRVTSPDDLKVVFRKASTDLLGYEIDDATAQKFAKTYQQMEIAEAQKQAAGGVFTSAASPSTVAEQQILQQFKPEAQSFAAANYAQIMDARIKELGA